MMIQQNPNDTNDRQSESSISVKCKKQQISLKQISSLICNDQNHSPLNERGCCFQTEQEVKSQYIYFYNRIKVLIECFQIQANNYMGPRIDQRISLISIDQAKLDITKICQHIRDTPDRQQYEIAFQLYKNDGKFNLKAFKYIFQKNDRIKPQSSRQFKLKLLFDTQQIKYARALYNIIEAFEQTFKPNHEKYQKFLFFFSSVQQHFLKEHSQLKKEILRLKMFFTNCLNDTKQRQNFQREIDQRFQKRKKNIKLQWNQYVDQIFSIKQLKYLQQIAQKYVPQIRLRNH